TEPSLPSKRRTWSFQQSFSQPTRERKEFVGNHREREHPGRHRGGGRLSRNKTTSTVDYCGAWQLWSLKMRHREYERSSGSSNRESLCSPADVACARQSRFDVIWRASIERVNLRCRGGQAWSRRAFALRCCCSKLHRRVLRGGEEVQHGDCQSRVLLMVG